MSGLSFDELEDLDGGANAQPLQGGGLSFDQLEDLDAADHGFKPWSKPGDAGSKTETAPGDTAGKAQWSSDLRTNLSDAAYSGAGGVMSGVGLNPREVLGGNVGAGLELAHERSPWSAGIGQVVGEGAAQAVAGVGPVVGGVLSGIGNTAGDLADKARGAVVGGVFGKIGGEVAGKLSALLGRGAQAADREAISQGLMHSGATRGDLKRLDQLGGREMFAEGAGRLGLTGRPSAVEGAAQRVVDQSEAARAGIVGNAGPDIDPAALGGAIRGSGQRYPGITPVQGAVERAAADAEALAPSQGAGAPWEQVNAQRQYYGDKTNFASGSPESNARKGIYGAFNDEMGDALSLRNAGDGDAWRQAGKNEQIALELGDIATAARDRARDRGLGLTDVAAGGLGTLLAGGNPLGAVAGVAAKRGLQANQHLIGQGVAKLSALGQRGAQSALDNAAPAIGGAAGELGASVASTPRYDQAALDVLYSGGDELGKYKQEIAQAAGSPNPGAVSDVITRLTMTDPEFRNTLLPLLRQRAGGG